VNEPKPRVVQKVVAFDLDGTLTTKDTLTQFLIWRAGYAKAFFKAVLLLPYFLGYAVGLVSRGRLKQAALRRFIKGVPAETMEMESQRFAKQVMPRLLRPEGLAALRAHVKAGDQVFVVTASPEFVSWAWTFKENVELVAEIAEEPLDAMEALDMVGLKSRAHHFPSELSGGEQQRVAIARAIAKRPTVLFCDEPTGALDIKTGVGVLNALQEVNAAFGATTLIITHAAVTGAIADRVLHLADGQLRKVETNRTKKKPEELVW